jgi:hypothetical protein
MTDGHRVQVCVDVVVNGELSLHAEGFYVTVRRTLAVRARAEEELRGGWRGEHGAHRLNGETSIGLAQIRKGRRWISVPEVSAHRANASGAIEHFDSRAVAQGVCVNHVNVQSCDGGEFLNQDVQIVARQSTE